MTVPLAPLSVCCSQEPLLLIETVDAIIARARGAGFTDREVLIAGSPGFHWNQLLAASVADSFFATKRIVELRIPTGKPGQDGAKALQRYCESLSPDVITIIVLPTVTWQDKKAVWFKALCQAGQLFDLKVPTREQLPHWILSRLKKQSQSASQEALYWFSGQIEGNLMAAHQEILKLGMLYPEGTLSLEDIQASLSQSARFHSDQLSDAFFQKNKVRYWQILQNLHQTEEPLPLLLWRLSEDARTLYKLLQQIERGQSTENAFKEARLFYERRDQFRRYLSGMTLKKLALLIQMLGVIDRQIKGLVAGDGWETLRRLPLIFLGKQN